MNLTTVAYSVTPWPMTGYEDIVIISDSTVSYEEAVVISSGREAMLFDLM
jgi:hypothetical protein